jgi:hypothetical protein
MKSIASPSMMYDSIVKMRECWSDSSLSLLRAKSLHASIVFFNDPWVFFR